MTLEKFASLDYFHWKMKSDLRAAKEMEERVDGILKYIPEPPQEESDKSHSQGKLL